MKVIRLKLPLPANFDFANPEDFGLGTPSSHEASEISNSALISEFVFSCGIEQSPNALSVLSLQVLKIEQNKNILKACLGDVKDTNQNQIHIKECKEFTTKVSF